MWDHSKVGMEVSNTDVKTTGSNNCREILEDNRDTNSLLAII